VVGVGFKFALKSAMALEAGLIGIHTRRQLVISRIIAMHRMTGEARNLPARVATGRGNAGQIATAAGGGLRYRRLVDTAVIVPMGVILVMAVIVVAAWWVGQNRRG